LGSRSSSFEPWDYDTLVVAGGSAYSYFGHEGWRPFALEVKSLDSALVGCLFGRTRHIFGYTDYGRVWTEF
jgi:hypothetical protein